MFVGVVALGYQVSKILDIALVTYSKFPAPCNIMILSLL